MYVLMSMCMHHMSAGECLESQNGVLRLLLALTDTGMGKKEEVIGSNVFSFAGALPTQVH